ncbi:nucleoside recognition domain protein [Solidesulfovibrio fructosivorans JJ]]|uniref:Nucleoside recognition domain protein n=1 Tax=Solidesulfovibrio fructosivorans JJ] TaxID=596151 RepID=E1K0E7_SOLFR|nr:nucleoside recognition domain-containing protein [Solidesulfovibrio fructosivorans]EFL49890.1 nucleoside recognition domain protein [Solidesulfovibrio fructosivorans JJ]]
MQFRLDQLPAQAAKVAKDAARICLDLFKVMVPILIGVKILKELGLITLLAKPLAPVMGLVGLPPECGLSWATAIANNLYAALAVHAALVPTMEPLTVAQATVIATMMLLAHNIFVEGAIAKKCGVGFTGQAVLRLAAALACGALLHGIFSGLDLFTEPAPLLFTPSAADASLAAWAFGEVKNLAMIYCVIASLVGLMRVLGALGVTRLFETALMPFLRLMGIGRAAATITVIGLVMGLAYGSGLILLDVRQGKVERRDVFSAISLMSLSHALIEDTLLMCLIGASLWGTFVGRLVFSLVVVAVLSRIAPAFARARTA